MEGKCDFDHRDRRIHALIGAAKRKGETHQKFTANQELLRWGKKRAIDVDGENGRWGELWGALIVGFHLELRIGELEHLDGPAISFGEVDGVTCVTVIIRGSKPDQQKWVCGVPQQQHRAICVLSNQWPTG